MIDLPGGELVRSRVVTDPGTVLTDALDCSLSGYAVLEPQEALLLDGEARGVLTFDSGVPVLAYHEETGRGGPQALADLAVPGPYRCDLLALPAEALAAVHDREAWLVPPGMPAERLAGDAELAARTRRRAPDDRVQDTAADDVGSTAEDAVAAFLEDEQKIAAIREQARAEARRRADEWGLDDLCED